jgi:hypothetical protein
MHRVLLLIVLASCVPTTYTYSPTTRRPFSSRPDDCSFEIATSTPSKSFDEVGTLQHYNGAEPRTVEELRKAVAKQVCGVGGDAVIAIANDKGLRARSRPADSVPRDGAAEGDTEVVGGRRAPEWAGWTSGRPHASGAAGSRPGLPPVAFLRKLCGPIPPPRRHLVRYAGGFGPAYRQRAKLRALVPPRTDESSGTPAPGGAQRGGRVPWAELLRRVFAAAVLACPCGGRRRLLAVVVDSALARTLLATLGLPCTPASSIRSAWDARVPALCSLPASAYP